MSNLAKISFAKSLAKRHKTIVVFCNSDLALPDSLVKQHEDLPTVVARAAKAVDYKGKPGTTLTIITPSGTEFDRLLLVGAPAENDTHNMNVWKRAGGNLAASAKSGVLACVAETLSAEQIANVAQGAYLRSYTFDRYKTKNKDKAETPTGVTELSFVSANSGDAKKIWSTLQAVADGTLFARDLVNEPANILTTTEFSNRLKDLEKIGVEVEVLTEKALAKLGMRALLAVGQGSHMPSTVVIMKWNGGKAKEAPLAFIGKGVVFDTGGISIKPSGGMEDMKGDMGGAAAVSGLMKAIAGRKAKTNVIGIVGLVENMPDGMAQRPGDIITSLSEQTIEVINTDAEGRLVLADLLWYAEDKFKPKFMINLATLTGAIIVALGHQHAGMFTNSDKLSDQLSMAGEVSGETVWRMPLGKEYDKLIDSKFADMKNTGGRWAGSVTAAQFLQRFVRDVEWAHLDVAGTAMGSPQTDINRSWGSGFGVQLLNQLIVDNYE